jgi:hypothetical protein
MNTKYFVVIMVMAAMLVGATAVSTIDSTFAGKKREYNEAASQTNACGNGEAILVDSVTLPVGAINVGCQNANSQIQGDENAISIVPTQTFP